VNRCRAYVVVWVYQTARVLEFMGLWWLAWLIDEANGIGSARRRLSAAARPKGRL